jgi:hypothetical protein
MHAAMVKPQDAVIVSVLAAVLALGLTLATPTIGLQVVVGFLIVLVAFTSVPASLFLLIGSMLLSPEIAVGRVDGRGVGVRELSLRVDDILLAIIGFSWLVKTIIYRDLALIRETPLNRPIVYYMLICVLATLVGVIAGRVRPLTGFFFILKYLEYFFVFFMVVNHVSTKQQVVRLVTALLAICFVISVCHRSDSQRATCERAVRRRKRGTEHAWWIPGLYHGDRHGDLPSFEVRADSNRTCPSFGGY